MPRLNIWNTIGMIQGSNWPLTIPVVGTQSTSAFQALSNLKFRNTQMLYYWGLSASTVCPVKICTSSRLWMLEIQGASVFLYHDRIQGSNTALPILIVGAHEDSINQRVSSGQRPEARAPGADDDGKFSRCLYSAFGLKTLHSKLFGRSLQSRNVCNRTRHNHACWAPQKPDHFPLVLVDATSLPHITGL